MRHPLVPLQLQLLAIGVLVAFISWVIHLIRHHRLSVRDSLLWLLSTIAALVATVFPISLQWIASALGIAVPSNAVFALAFVYVLLNLLASTITLSGNAARIRRIAQECTLLRAELDALRARVERGGGGCT
ncbi:MAG: hypothetical protein A2V77_06835 [Anaeromyxobacter sp. RBG_16_69_14]|nr:MAG: hypothetical protein A2V77_06835 [Anaeromyxobacter sp. RBG_16_69_14]